MKNNESLLELVHGNYSSPSAASNYSSNRGSSSAEEIAKLRHQIQKLTLDNSVLSDTNYNLRQALKTVEVGGEMKDKGVLLNGLRELEADVVESREKNAYLEYTVGKQQGQLSSAEVILDRSIKVLRELSTQKSYEEDDEEEDNIANMLDISGGGYVMKSIVQQKEKESSSSSSAKMVTKVERTSQTATWPWDEEMEEKVVLCKVLEREVVAQKQNSEKLKQIIEKLKNEIQLKDLRFDQVTRDMERLRIKLEGLEKERNVVDDVAVQTMFYTFDKSAQTEAEESDDKSKPLLEMKLTEEEILVLPIKVVCESGSNTEDIRDRAWLEQLLHPLIMTTDNSSQLSLFIDVMSQSEEASPFSPLSPKKPNFDLTLHEISQNDEHLAKLVVDLRSDSPLLCAEAAATICNVALRTKKTIPILCRQGVVPALVMCLQNKNPKVLETALGALTNLGVDDGTKQEFASLKGLRFLHRALATKNPTIQYHACGALWSLSANCNENKAVTAETIALLVELLQSRDDVLKLQAAGALGNLCAGVKENKVLVGALGGIEALTQCLSSSNDMLCTQAAICLGNLSVGTKKNRTYFKRSHSIDALSALAARVPSDSVATEEINAAFLRLSNSRQKRKMIEKGGLQRQTSAPLAGIEAIQEDNTSASPPKPRGRVSMPF